MDHATGFFERKNPRASHPPFSDVLAGKIEFENDQVEGREPFDVWLSYRPEDLS